ncbi:arginase-1 isoform X5 [Maniola hyperantus]|uniref:arginase-1 isoform X5 n=1 Tax=Aphantopus hyperantus TaxID=2795564 RepID=UPI003748B8F4
MDLRVNKVPSWRKNRYSASRLRTRRIPHRTRNMSFVRKMSRKQLVNWEPLKKIGIIGVPFEKGQKKYGVSVAPAAMRSAGLIDHLKEICTVDGHYKVNDNMILIWVDAHADINTNKTSESGSVHGMPVALLVKELSDYWPYLPTMDWQVPQFSIKNLGYVGLRSVDEYERLAIEKYGVPAFAMEDIEECGIQKCIHHILQKLDPDGTKPIHVSFDIDSLDSLEAPSTGTAVRGGLTLREGIKLMEIIYATGRLRAIDLVEINPALGNDSDRKRTIDAGLCILKAALGFSRRGTMPRGVLDLPVQTHHETK